MIKYQTVYTKASIEEIEIDRETEKCVIFKDGTKGLKYSKNYNYWDTWEEAHNYLLEQANLNLKNARHQLQRCQDKLGNIKGIKKPGEAKQ